MVDYDHVDAIAGGPPMGVHTQNHPSIAPVAKPCGSHVVKKRQLRPAERVERSLPAPKPCLPCVDHGGA